MKFFSKRNKKIEMDDDSIYYHGVIKKVEFITKELRNRLIAEISYLTSCDDFLEFFILFEDQKKEVIFLDKDKVDGFSLKELGYRTSDYFEFNNFAIKEQKHQKRFMSRNDDGKMSRVEKDLIYFNDSKLFDLIEFIILFSKKEKRNEIIKRFNDILSEEETLYEIINGMITTKSGEDIYKIQSLLIDGNLKNKIDDYEHYEKKEDFVSMAKVSSEILNIIFSDYKRDGKKYKIEEILKKISYSLAHSKKDSDKLFVYLNEELNNIKRFNNDIYNIRHTEKSTVQLKGGKSFVYKSVAVRNISFAEMIIISIKEEFIYSEDWESVKDNYISKYNINRDLRSVIKNNEIDDIPF